jgi:hypothetical protein
VWEAEGNVISVQIGVITDQLSAAVGERKKIKMENGNSEKNMFS